LTGPQPRYLPCRRRLRLNGAFTPWPEREVEGTLALAGLGQAP
jgi:hypothetical protein